MSTDGMELQPSGGSIEDPNKSKLDGIYKSVEILEERGKRNMDYIQGCRRTLEERLGGKDQEKQIRDKLQGEIGRVIQKYQRVRFVGDPGVQMPGISVVAEAIQNLSVQKENRNLHPEVWSALFGLSLVVTEEQGG